MHSAPGVVVIGAGLGGLRVVEQLRRNGHAGPVTLVGQEPHLLYDRPPLSKQVLRGELDSTVLRSEFDSLHVGLRLGRSAISLDPGARTVHLDDDTDIGYSALVLAPGGRPRLLPGLLPRQRVHVLRTIDDALALRAAIGADPAGTRRAVVVGGGFIGCEVAASLRHLGAEIDLVEALPHPLARVLGLAGGRIVTELLESGGVRVHTGLRVTAVEPAAGPAVAGAAVELSDSARMAADAVIVALGIVPAVDWLDGSGLRLDDGIVCDGAGRTSVPDVYALGDAARWPHPLVDGPRRVEHWSTVCDQAGVVAAAITGNPAARLTEVPYFWSDQFDVRIQALGFVDPDDDVERHQPDGRSVLLYSRAGVLRSVVGFGAPRNLMRMRSLIADRGSVAEARALLAA